ncbi:MAG: cyd operon YbgE family protein [Gammaproteobacteria bacterium]|nr:cyd operon YbgE family protein [Gammaproteobacteria bacterium]
MSWNVYGAFSRTLSLIMASSASLVILLMPHAVTSVDNKIDHSLLMVIMLGTMIGFIHGVGFKPQSGVYRKLSHHLLGWSLMIVGLLYLYFPAR